MLISIISKKSSSLLILKESNFILDLVNQTHIPGNIFALLLTHFLLHHFLEGLSEILAWLKCVLLWCWFRPRPVRHDHTMGALRRAHTASIPHKELSAWLEIPAIREYTSRTALITSMAETVAVWHETGLLTILLDELKHVRAPLIN